ncbi:MAG TPA: T9SS type A sorting domain-containing protein [Saprospiraceae bacterium]|nr:T9SS type A sorting domain-containing protein [Saprospiraceae bacterium]
MKKTITFLCLKRCWLPVVLALFYSLSMSAQADTCNLVCNDHVNASMPADGCLKTFVPDDFLENPGLTCTTYDVELSYPYGTAKLPGGDQVNRSHIGYTFIYRVIETVSRNSCWGYVTIEDKAAPQPVCKNVRVSCFQVARLSEIVGEIIDNCGQAGSSAIESMQWSDWGCDSVSGLGRVIRTIRTWDDWGNSATCSDTLTIGRDSLSNVTCPDPIVLGCRVNCQGKGITLISKDKNSPNYPSPDFLLDLQKRDTAGGGRKCVPAGLKVVPFIDDSVLVMQGSVCILVDSSVAMYPAPGGFCKTSLTWTDQIIPICGTGFKIRREWLIVDWCNRTDTTCVQYIKVEDSEDPIVKSNSKFYYKANTSPHNCYANINLDALIVDDCDVNAKQSYIAQYTLESHPAKINVINGTLPGKISLPAIPSDYKGKAFHRLEVSIVDACLNRTDTAIYVKVSDVTPPNPVCDEYTRTTVDPSTCWARVYAADLDNGSRDNCCNVLHFAVAHMDTIEAARNAWKSYWTANCNSTYWKYKDRWDDWLEAWINVFIFKDYIDLSECGENQVVLRVYEACGVPLYDPHVFPCSKHDWFTYNSFKLSRLWHNYKFFYLNDKTSPNYKNCTSSFGPFCKPTHWDPPSVDYSGRYPGSETYVRSCEFEFGDEESLPSATNNFGGLEPGNTCSARLYNDCMVIIYVDDKTPPVCEEPADLYWYCDNVADAREIKGKKYFIRGHRYNRLEYAHAVCDIDYHNDNILASGNGKYDYDPTLHADDGSCRYDYTPYNEIECEEEFDGDLTDAVDATGKAFGWYGCNIYGPAHQDEHGYYKEICEDDHDNWAPIYCHTWLCLDRKDSGTKVDPKTAFWTPVLRSGGRGADVDEGQFIIWDNCWIGTITSVDESYVDNCGNGWLKRTWTTTDKCGSPVVCDQKIITKHRSDFEVEFPADLTVSCDVEGSLSPDGTGRPIIMDDECELVGVNYEDVRYDIVPDACYKIVRTWKLIDWCKYDPNAHYRKPEVIVDDRKVAHPTDRYCVYRHLKDEGDGYITYTQIIKVIDTVAPVITCTDTTICLYTGTDANCTAPNLSVPFIATDNCTASDKISFRWELDLNASASDVANHKYNKASIDDKSYTPVTAFSSNTIKDGTHLVHVIASDNCGNVDTCTFVLTVKDCKEPTPYCHNGIATVIMPSTGEITIWASDLDAGSYDNCTPKSNLVFSFGPDKSVTSKVFTCADIPNGTSNTIEVDIYVWDAYDNKDYCRTYLLLQDGIGNKCTDNLENAGSIAGKISTENDDAVEKVKMNVKAPQNMPAYLTDVKGQYSFGGLPMKADYSIIPARNDDPMNGVSTIDLVLIQKHILGSSPLNSPYKIIAADVDKNTDITVLDLVELRKLILAVYDELPNNQSWRFVPKTYQFEAGKNPLKTSFPEQIDISKLSQNELNRDFVGIKIGDVNTTATPHSLLGAEAREASATLQFRTEDRQLKAGETATIDFRADNFSGIEGYQFSLALHGLTLVDIQKGSLEVDASNFGLTKLNQGYLTTSWSKEKGARLNPNDVAFSLKVKATKDVTLSESLKINSRFTRAEAYAEDGNNTKYLGVSLEIGKSSRPSNYVLYQNTPNPFKAQTLIGFELAKNEAVTLSVTDVTGKLIKSYQIDGVKGANQLVVNRNEFGSAGVLYYSIKTKSFSDTKKMLLVE